VEVEVAFILGGPREIDILGKIIALYLIGTLYHRCSPCIYVSYLLYRNKGLIDVYDIDIMMSQR